MLVLELEEEKDVLELYGGNTFIMFDDDGVDEDSPQYKLIESLSLVLFFTQALMGVATVILM